MKEKIEIGMNLAMVLLAAIIALVVFGVANVILKYNTTFLEKGYVQVLDPTTRLVYWTKGKGVEQ